MAAPVIPKIPRAVQASFEPVMKVISAVRAQLSDVKDVVATRPGYKYPPAGQPVPAIVGVHTRKAGIKYKKPT